jgi:hypothetical protein
MFYLPACIAGLLIPSTVRYVETTYFVAHSLALFLGRKIESKIPDGCIFAISSFFNKQFTERGAKNCRNQG